jgi:four helix bundle protein
LVKQEKEFVLSKQIMESGTSIGANVEEAHGGISQPDFSNKISIAYKEARETKYWLKLLYASDLLDKKIFDSLMIDCEEICKILFSILKVTRYKSKKEKTISAN